MTERSDIFFHYISIQKSGITTGICFSINPFLEEYTAFNINSKFFKEAKMDWVYIYWVVVGFFMTAIDRGWAIDRETMVAIIHFLVDLLLNMLLA